MPTPPNILWIMTDQHRADCLGFMGHPAVQTPHLDRLAADGIVFENAFCQSPVCMASRASLFTGRYPEAMRVRGMGVLPPAEVTLPEMLQRAGYRTAAFGKTHLTPELYTRQQLQSDVPILDWQRFAEDACLSPIPDDPYKRDYGFALHVGCDDANQQRFREWLRQCAPELADCPRPPAIAGGPGDMYVSPFPSEYHQTSFVTDTCIDYLRAQTPDQPWFAFCSFVAPHHPFEAPAEQIARYPLDDIPLPEYKGGVDPAFLPPIIAAAADEIAQYPAAMQQQIVQHYLAAISLIDDNIGKLLSALAETGQLENTIILFNADHGEFLGNHGLLRKPSVHLDELLRVPCLLRLPGGQGGGRRVSGLIELTDICPTLLGLLNLSRHPGIQGIDWSDALHEGTEIGRTDVYSSMFDLTPQRFGTASGPYGAAHTLRTPEWKLTLYPAGREYGQLFDLRHDPDEAHNRYADPAYRDIREAMLWALLQRIHRNTDPLPLVLTQW